MPPLPSRRLLLGQGLSALAVAAWPRAGLARPEDVAYAVLQDFGKVSPQEGRVTLEMPAHSDAGTSVPLELRIDSPMTADDFPETVGLYASGNPRPRLATLRFTPACGTAWFATRVRLNSAQDVVAVARMRDGSFWQGKTRVSVTFGACNTAGESDRLPPDWLPQTRIAVPTARPGEIVTLRTVITHPMETGLRLDAHNAYLPLWIIRRFTCRLDGAEVFSVSLEPAIASNPYLAFTLRADRAGQLEFEWQDSRGPVITRHEMLQLV